MTNPLKIVASILMFFIAFSLQAQEKGNGGRAGMKRGANGWKGKISGTVRDSASGKPILFATISLFNQKDSLVTGTTSKTTGKFLIENVPAGKYYARVEYMGYSKKFVRDILMSPKSDELIKQLGNIYISKSAKTVGNTTVVKRKSVFINEIDKKVFNADQNITSTGGTAVDLIENVPSIEVDQDGNISLRGNTNVIILIDGRPSGLTGAGRQAFLESIPASSIDRIEIITNPSAKYDPDGMSGIINIILKKNKIKGSSGMVSTTLGTGGSYNFSSRYGYRNSKFNIYGNYSMNINNSWSDGGYDRTTFGDTIEYLSQISDGNRYRESHLVKFGFDYYINQFNTLYISANKGFGTRNGDQNVLYHNTDNNFNPLFSYLRSTEDLGDNFSTDFSIGYVKKFNQKNHELTADLYYTNSERENDSEIGQFDQNSSTDLFDLNPLYQNTERVDKNDIYTLQVDYTKPLAKNIKLETGYKLIYRNINNAFYSESKDTGELVYSPDTFLNNTFDYVEEIHAAYGILGTQRGKLGLQAGLRVEQAFTTSTLEDGESDPFENDYLSLFPSAHIKYELTKSKELMLSYGRRINRPRTRSLNPFANQSDPFKLFKGNPFLKPEYINSYELGYSYYNKKFSFTSTVYYRQTVNMMSRIKLFDSTTGISTVTYANFNEGSSYGLEMIANVNPTKNWRMTLSTNTSASKFSTDNLTFGFDNSSTRFSSRLMSTWTYNKNHSLQISGFYRAPFDIPQGVIKGMYGVDAAYKVRLMKGKASLGFRVSDVFNIREFGYSTEDIFLKDDGNRKWLSQRAYVSFTYNFGTQQRQTRRQKRNGNGNGGEDMGM
jgi:iron complex outermembrane receptor protein